MKKLIKFFLYTCLVLTVLFTVLLSVLFFKEKEIYNYALKELNAVQTGKTNIQTIQLAPFRAFPYVSVDLKGLSFYPNDTAKEAIYIFDDVYVGFDVWDLMQGNIIIKKIVLSDGFVHLEKNEQGELNLLLAKAPKKASKEVEEETGVHLDIQSVIIKNVALKEHSEHIDSKKINLNIDHLNLSFSSIQNDIDVKVDADFFVHEFIEDGVKLLKGKRLKLNSRVHYDTQKSFLSIDKSKLWIEDNKFVAEGTVDFENNTNLNIEIHGRKDNFDLLFAFAPPEILEKLKQFKNEGQIYFDGYIKGPVAKANPSFDLNFGCVNTMFFHHINQTALKDFEFKGNFSSGAKNTPETYEFSLTNIYGVPESGQLEGTFKVRNFLDPQFSVDFHSDLDLENIANFWEIEGLDHASGNIKIDIAFDEFIGEDSLIHIATNLEEANDTKITLSNVDLKFDFYPLAFQNINGFAQLDGDDLILKELGLEIGESDFNFDFKLSNLTALLYAYDVPVDLDFHVFGDQIVLQELLNDTLKKSFGALSDDRVRQYDLSLNFHSNALSLNTFTHYPTMDLKLNNLSFNLDQYPYPLKDFKGDLKLQEDKIELKHFGSCVGKNNLFLDLAIHQAQHLFVEGKNNVNVDVHLQSDYLNFEEMMVYNGKSLIAQDVRKELKKEELRDLIFDANGDFFTNSFSEKGFYSIFNLSHLQFKWNDFPMLSNTSGKLKTDSTGCIYLENFITHIGKSDFKLNLAMENYLNPLDSEKLIQGELAGKLWDFNEFQTYLNSDEVTYDTLKNPHEEAFNLFALPFPNAKLHVKLDKFRNQKYKIDNFTGYFRSNPQHQIYIDTLSFEAAEGSVGIKAYLNGANKDDVYAKGKVYLDEINIDKVLYKVDNFGEDYAFNKNFKGRVSGRLDADIRLYPDLAADLKKSTVHMEVKISEGEINNFPPMHEMAEFLGDKNLDHVRFAELENVLDFKEGKLSIPKMKIASTLGYLYLSGSQELNDDVQYNFEVPLSLVKKASINMMRSRLFRSNPQKEVNNFDEEIITEQSGRIQKYLGVIMSGNLNDEELKVKLNSLKSNN